MRDRDFQRFIAKHSLDDVDDDIADEADAEAARQHAPAPDYRITEEELSEPKCPTCGNYFGQCVPKDATMLERIESASVILLLDDPDTLLQALYDAGLQLVSPADREVLAIVESNCAFGGEGSWMRENLPTLYEANRVRVAFKVACGPEPGSKTPPASTTPCTSEES